MKLKSIEPSDLGRLSKLFTDNNIDKVIQTFTPFELSPEMAMWIACEPHKDHFYLGIIHNIPIGFSMLRGWDEGFSVPSFGIFIDHRQHGQGLGKQLLDLTIEEAKKLQCHHIRLSVYASNPSACKIYRSRGFKETDRKAVMNKGFADEKIVMLKDI